MSWARTELHTTIDRWRSVLAEVPYPPCPICRIPAYMAVLTESNRTTVFKCVRCGTLHAEDKPSPPPSVTDAG
jgi:hypothetical protein